VQAGSSTKDAGRDAIAVIGAKYHFIIRMMLDGPAQQNFCAD
jgi:hypothetical protein